MAVSSAAEQGLHGADGVPGRGPGYRSIQGTVDQFRAALGGVNNGNVAGPLDAGRREINWDGGGSTATSPAPTPFSGFLVTRGALFTTPGTGFVQAPVEASSQPSTILTTRTSSSHSAPVRVFVPVNSNRTTVEFLFLGRRHSRRHDWIRGDFHGRGPAGWRRLPTATIKAEASTYL